MLGYPVEDMPRIGGPSTCEVCRNRVGGPRQVRGIHLSGAVSPQLELGEQRARAINIALAAGEGTTHVQR